MIDFSLFVPRNNTFTESIFAKETTVEDGDKLRFYDCNGKELQGDAILKELVENTNISVNDTVYDNLKVTVDGLDISDPTGTQSETYLQDISIGDIKKIEILHPFMFIFQLRPC